MKTFKQFFEDINPTTPTPIHFKCVGKKVNESEEGDIHPLITRWINHNKNKHLGNTNDEISKKLHSSNKFSRGHKNILSAYTHDSDSSKILNNHLIAGTNHKEARKIASKLDDAIHSNRIAHDVHVYSGTNFDPKNHISKIGLMHSPAFISATHSRQIAYHFSSQPNDNEELSHVIHLHLKKGDPATHICHVSHSPEEHETLIKRNVVLRHEGHTDIQTPFVPYKNRYTGDTEQRTLRIHHMTIHKEL